MRWTTIFVSTGDQTCCCALFVVCRNNKSYGWTIPKFTMWGWGKQLILLHFKQTPGYFLKFMKGILYKTPNYGKFITLCITCIAIKFAIKFARGICVRILRQNFAREINSFHALKILAETVIFSLLVLVIIVHTNRQNSLSLPTCKFTNQPVTYFCNVFWTIQQTYLATFLLRNRKIKSVYNYLQWPWSHIRWKW